MVNGDAEQAPVKKFSLMQSEPPFWWPDSRGFLMAAIIGICAQMAFYRMGHPAVSEDKILDMMITILFSTCLVMVYNWRFGSSSGKEAQDATMSKMAEKPVAPVAVVAPVAPVAPIAPLAPAGPSPWWTKLTTDEKNAITAAKVTDPRVDAFVAASMVGSATPDDLAYLVAKIPPLLTPERAAQIPTL